MTRGGFSSGAGAGESKSTVKIPVTAKTGDEVHEADQSAKFLMLQDLVNILVDDLSHIPDLYTRLRSRRNSQSKQTVEVSSSDMLRPFSILRGMPTDYMSQMLASHSDMTTTDLVAARSTDEESTIELLVFGTQLPASLRTVAACHARPAMTR